MSRRAVLASARVDVDAVDEDEADGVEVQGSAFDLAAGLRISDELLYKNSVGVKCCIKTLREVNATS